MIKKWNVISSGFRKFSKTTYFILLLSALTLFSYFMNVTAIG